MSSISHQPGSEAVPSRQPARSKFKIWFALAGCLVLGCFCSLAGEPPRTVPGRILVKPRPGISQAQFNARLALHGRNFQRLSRRSALHALNVAPRDTEAVLFSLRNDPDIEYAEPDYLISASFVPNDPLVQNEWHLGKIQAGPAWDITSGSTNVIVAVLDSGVNAAHPDLAGRILPGYDFVWNDNNADDDFGHGTAVAGTIVAAGDNGIGVAGVAFGCRVLPVKVMDGSGIASHSAIAQGIEYAVSHGARVINLSMGGEASSSTLQDAINYAWSKNVVVVAAAGNTGGSVPQYPAACEHVVAVGATEPDDTRAWFSSYGSFVALAAPGDSVWTTQRDLANPYAPWSGTSFASPLVAAVAALVSSINPALSNSQIVDLLEQTADDIGVAGNDQVFGHGRVNAFRAIAAAYPGVLPVQPPNTNSETVLIIETNPPSISISFSPVDGARLFSDTINLAGSAADDTGVSRVELRLNNNSWQTISGTTAWNAQVVLSPGLNTILVRSVDLAGNFSPTLSRSFTYVMYSSLTLVTNGLGSILPPRNSTPLEVGKSYTIRATPAPGQVFAGWKGIASPSPLLTFVMQPSLELTANFIPNPFLPVRGSYNGLVDNQNGVTPANSGAFNLTVTSSGIFTGRILLAGSKYGFHGRLDLNGDASVIINRNLQSPLNLRVHLELSNASEQVIGSLSDGSWTSALSGNRSIFNSQFHPAPQAGTRSLKLSRTDDTEAANGLSRIAVNGSTRVRGMLVDGRAFAMASAISRNGDCPFYLSLNHGAEVVIGWLNFPVGQGPSANGTVLWVKGGTNAFAATLQAASAPPQ